MKIGTEFALIKIEDENSRVKVIDEFVMNKQLIIGNWCNTMKRY